MTQAEWSSARYEEHVQRVVAGIHRLAEDVKRAAEVRNGDYAWAVQQVVHALAWGNANLKVDILISAASDAQVALANETQQ